MASITKNSAEEASERKGSNGSDDRAGYYNDWEKKAKKLGLRLLDKKATWEIS